MFKYEKVVNELKDEIVSSKWKPGERFLGVQSVCRRFQVSHLTAVKIIKNLEALHLVKSRRGAGTFVTQRRKLIAFLSPSFGLAPFFPLIRSEISKLFQKNGITFKICEVKNMTRADFPSRLEQAARDLIAEKPSGIIYLPASNITPLQDCTNTSSNIDRTILSAFDKAAIPVILIDSGIESPMEDRYDLVGVDNRAIGIKLGQHLLQQNIRSVMFVHWKSNSPNVRDRRAGLLETVCAANVPFSDYELTKSNIGEFRQLLKSPSRPDALVGSSDRIALMVLHVLKKSRIDVPASVLLAGVDDTELAKTTPPGLTSVQQPYRDIARAACELLLNRMARPATPPRHLTIASTLIPRLSTLRSQTGTM